MSVFKLGRAVRFLALAALLSGTLCASGRAAEGPPLNRFEFAVDAIEMHDRASMPAAGGTVFVGSSTFAHWKTMESELQDLHAINHGFGGSTMPEVEHYFDRLVTSYKPSRIVVYAGTNDIAEGHSGEQVARDFASVLALAHKKLPGVEVYFISMSMAPSRVQWAGQYVQGNRLIETMAKSDPLFHYIDVTRVMYDDRGILHKEYFGPDRLHMNKAGYDAWVPVLRQALAVPAAVH